MGKLYNSVDFGAVLCFQDKTSVEPSRLTPAALTQSSTCVLVHFTKDYRWKRVNEKGKQTNK